MARHIDRLKSRARRGFRGYPLATVAFYGPTNEFASKVAVGIVTGDGVEPGAMRKWLGGQVDVRRDPGIAGEIVSFIEAHGARSVVVTRGIIGCPHEEGVDYPVGDACPRCPFWAGRDRWKDV